MVLVAAVILVKSGLRRSLESSRKSGWVTEGVSGELGARLGYNKWSGWKKLEIRLWIGKVLYIIKGSSWLGMKREARMRRR